MSPKLSLIPDKPERYCSFCGRSEHDADILVAGGVALICDGCVDQSAEIVASSRAKTAGKIRGQNHDRPCRDG